MYIQNQTVPNLYNTWMNENLSTPELFDIFSKSPVSSRHLKTDIIETKEQYCLFVEMPGVAAKDIDVLVEHGLITVKGFVELDKSYKIDDNNESQFMLKERAHKTFTRQFSLPYVHSDSSIEATMKNGLLKLEVMKRQSNNQKRVEVRAA